MSPHIAQIATAATCTHHVISKQRRAQTDAFALRHHKRHHLVQNTASVSADTSKNVCCRALAAGSWFEEPIQATAPARPDPSLINADLAPTTTAGRTFDMWDLAALWVGLVVCIPTYYLAGSLVELGMSWLQGILTVFAGNLITLVPMVLNAHPGTKYGIPFPVLARASFGVKGANLPSLLRGLVACGWFGIQTWVGSCAIHQMLCIFAGRPSTGVVIAWLGISAPQLACFMGFWAIQAVIIVKGIESIRLVEKYAAPLLILMSTALLAWAYTAAGGFGPMLSAPSQFAAGMPQAGKFWGTFWPAITANVGFWATLSLNIPDFTRYAKSQRDQLAGQALGLPLVMALFTFVGLAVTSATVSIYGTPIADPILLLSKLQGAVPLFLALTGLLLATLSTNIAANVVAPANALINLAPSRLSFPVAGLMTSILGVLVMPWKLISSTQGFIYTWLIGYSALLGPIAGIIIADYFVLRRRKLNVDALYSASPDEQYWYHDGWNSAAMAALTAGVLPNLPGFLHAVGLMQWVPMLFRQLYAFAWFVGFGIAFLTYLWLMRGSRDSPAIMKLA